jgi:hypothetical protein
MFFRLLKRLDFRKLVQMLGFAIKQPITMLQTFKATRACIKLCDATYGKTHHLHNRANAVRHALWNFLIAKRVAGSSKNHDAALRWTTKITSWHEEFSVNIPTAKAMDLHNNEIGRNLFVTHPTKTATYMLEHLQELAKNALQISSPEDIIATETRLVFISEAHV